jgi:YidC/Oxa1 family membrane protein insertase
LDEHQVKPLEVRFSDAKINEEAFKTPYTTSTTALDLTQGVQTVTLTQKLSTLTLTKKITFKPSGEYDIIVSTSKPVPYFITPGYRPVADRSKYMLVRGALIKGADNIITTIEDGKAKGDESFKNAKIASAFDRYYASIFFDFEKGMNLSILKEKEDKPEWMVHIPFDKVDALIAALHEAQKVYEEEDIGYHPHDELRSVTGGGGS